MSVASLPADFPFSIEHMIVEALEVQHCVNSQKDALAQSPAANESLVQFQCMQSRKAQSAWASHARAPISSTG